MTQKKGFYQSGSRGFTLIEVLVALVIVSLSVISIYSAFAGISDTLARIDNYNRSVLMTLEKFWELEEALLQPKEVYISDFSGELKDERRSFVWEFESNELEDYPSLKEITFTIQWQQGKRTGQLQAGTYLKAVWRGE